MFLQYRVNKDFKSDVNFEGLEIPSEFTIAKAEWITSKMKPRKLTFSDEVTVHEYEVNSNCSSDSNSILCEESLGDSDSLFNTDTESESENDSFEFLGGKRAKKTFKVKFGQIP